MTLKRTLWVEGIATRDLLDLAEKGIFVRAGGGRSTHYQINL
jgi:hypothetical protein